MKLKELKRRVDGTPGTAVPLYPILEEWSEEGRYKNSSEQYLMGVVYVLEHLHSATEPMSPQIELFHIVNKTEVMTMIEFKELFHTFSHKVAVSFLLSYCYEDEHDQFDMFLSYKGYEPTGAPHHGICNLIEETGSVPFILSNVGVLKKIVDDDHSTFIKMSNMEDVSLKSIFTDALRRAKTDTARELMLQSLTFDPLAVVDIVSSKQFYKYLERIKNRTEDMVTDTIPLHITDERYLRVAPTTEFFNSLGVSEVNKKKFIEIRKLEVKQQINALANGIKKAVGNSSSLPHEIKVKIVTYAIDTIDELWIHKLKVFPLDDDTEARENISQVIAKSQQERPVVESDRPRKAAKTSVNMSDDERAVARRLAVEIKQVFVSEIKS